MLSIKQKTNRAKFRVKIKSLAVESLIIKKEENKAIPEVRESLHHHRVEIVKREQRYTLLAYAYYRGKKYRDVEKTCKNPPNIKTINRILKSLTGSAAEDLNDWLK